MRCAIVLVACVLVGPLAGALEVGIARCDITPDVAAYKVPMAGYGARMGRPSEGVHDPLQAKVLVFRDGDTTMALVTADVRSCTSGFKTQIVEKAGAPFTHDTVLVCASHIHSGPSMYPERFWQLQFGTYDPAIVQIMSTAVAEAIREAAEGAAPAKVGFGQARVEGFTRNRRWEYDTAAREAASETPAMHPVLGVLRVDGLDGACRALLVHFASHPTILGADNMLLSAGWPGVLQRELEEAFPGAMALYCNGAQGDQAPAGAQGADGFARIEDYGARLAQEAARVARDVTTRADAPVACARVLPELPSLVFSEAAQKGRYAHMAEAALEALPRQAEIQVFGVGDLALVGLPGEPLCEVGLATERAARAAGFANAVAVGLANNYIGYLVDEKEYAHGGYEVDARSYYGPGLGALIAEHAGAAAKAAGTAPSTGKAIALFNGRDFSGWKLFVPDSTVDPATVWSVRDGVVHCTGRPAGYMRTEKAYGDYRLRFEWRWPTKGGNSGLLVHISGRDKVWPKSIEGQLANENAGDFWVIGGTDFKEHTNKGDRRVPKKRRHNERDIGQWNTMEAVCAGNTIRLYVNGLLQNEATETTVTEGCIGLQSEGTPVEFRHIVLEPLE